MVCVTYERKYAVAMKRGGAKLSVVDALAQLSFLVQNSLVRISAEHDLSVVQTRLLGVLRDRTPSMNELARFLELDKSSVTGLVDRAERRGLVRRTISTEDRRGIDVSITAAGRKVGRLVEVELEQRIEELVEQLTNAERAGLSDVVTRIVVAEAKRHGLEVVDIVPDARG
jgi:DNA-binding MarR family transcriptional regulator